MPKVVEFLQILLIVYIKSQISLPSEGVQENISCMTFLYRIARKFCVVKFLRKLIRLSFCDFIFADSNPIAIINDINIVSRIKIFMGRDKSAKTEKILPHKTF